MARRTAEDAAVTQATILSSARACFTERGYSGTSTAMVADRAGVTRGALYHHFADKADLFRAVFTDLTHELNESVITAGLSRSDALDAVRAGCRAMLEFCTTPEYRQISVLDAPAVLGMDEWQRLDSAVGTASFEAGLDLLVQQGYLDARPGRATVLLWFGSLTAAGLALARGGPDVPSIDEIIEAVVAMIVPARQIG